MVAYKFNQADNGCVSGITSEGNMKPLILSRNLWAGAAAHGAALWSSDIECSWKEFRAQVIVGISAGLSGIPYWSSDVSLVFIGCCCARHKLVSSRQSISAMPVSSLWRFALTGRRIFR